MTLLKNLDVVQAVSLEKWAWWGLVLVYWSEHHHMNVPYGGAIPITGIADT